ncbi:MAG: polysaccharide biosynthesis tyrosine autokinase [Bacteroidota bacterium]
MNNLEPRKRSNQQFLPADRPLNGHAAAIPPQPAAGAESTSINFGDILGTILDGKWIILATCILISAGIAAFKLTETKVFEASSLVSINTAKSGSSPIDRLSPYGVDGRTQADELSFLINSGELSKRVASRLRDAAMSLGSDSLFSALRSANGGPTATAEEAAIRLRGMVFFMPAEQSMINMKAVSTSKYEAVRLVNLYAEEYKAIEKERSQARLANARDFTRARLDERRDELTALDYEWEAVVSTGDAITSGSAGEMLLQQYGQLSAKLQTNEIQLETERKLLEHLKGEYARVSPNLVTSVSSGADKEIEALQGRIADLKMEAEEYYMRDPSRRGREAEIPELNDIVTSINHLEGQKNALAEKLVAETLSTGGGSSSTANEPLSYAKQLSGQIIEKEFKISEISLNIGSIRQRITETKEKLDQVPGKMLQQNDVERRRAVVEAGYKTLQQELQQMEIALEHEIGNVSVVREAQFASPVGNNLTQSLVLGLILGLGFGTGIAFLRKAVDRRIQKPSDIKDMGFNLIGVIPEMHPEIKASYGGDELVQYNGGTWNTHLISVLQPSSSIAENYRLTRTNIDFLFEDQPPQVVLITSPESGDGKSVTSVNLAATMAESGRRTLLIDLDLRRPSCHKLLGINRAPGFVDLLMNPGEFLLEEFETSVRDLHFIPAGSTSTRASELVGSSVLRDGLHSLREMFDTIIIDSPPVLAVTDAVVISTLCDATIVVANANATDNQSLTVTRQTLEAVGVNVAGVILNRFNGKNTNMRAYSVYGYDGTYGYSSQLEGAPS